MDDGLTLLGIVAAFVACLATMGGGLVHVVKRLLERSDTALVARDKEVMALVGVVQQQASDLKKAIEAFSNFEKEEEKVHSDIISRLDIHEGLLKGISTSLERTTQLQAELLKSLQA